MFHFHTVNKFNSTQKDIDSVMKTKKIHYCWFGRNVLGQEARKCIASWKKFLPEYEIIEWNEDNFDVHQCRYSSEAYKMKKYAFVSDYARFKILNEQGGIYFDTDVELIASPKKMIETGPFMGVEKSSANGSGDVGVAPGLGIYLEPHMPIVEEIISFYESRPFSFGDHTVVTIMTKFLNKYNFKPKDCQQYIQGLTIYPSEYLCPMDSTTGEITITPNTVSIHHYSASWLDHNSLSFKLHTLKNLFIKIFGKKVVVYVCNLLKGRI